MPAFLKTAIKQGVTKWSEDDLFFLTPACSWYNYRLIGLVVKASTSRAGGPGFESR